MSKKKGSVAHIRVVAGIEYFFLYEYETLQECQEVQNDYKMEGTITRRFKMEDGKYRLYIRSK
jgi:hypothetical protein